MDFDDFLDFFRVVLVVTLLVLVGVMLFNGR